MAAFLPSIIDTFQTTHSECSYECFVNTLKPRLVNNLLSFPSVIKRFFIELECNMCRKCFMPYALKQSGRCQEK